MKRYDRTWPMSLAAIAVGGAIGFSLFGPHHFQFGDDVPKHELTARAGAPAGPAVEKKLLPPRARRPMEPIEIEDVEPRERIQITRFVGMSTDETLQVLRSAPSADDRRNAAIFLGTSGDPGRVLGAMLIALRTDDSAEVRFTVAESLGRLGRTHAKGPLHLAATLDEDLRVRESAAAALGTLGHPESVPVLGEVLATDVSDDVRVQAALALIRIGTPEARLHVDAAVRSGLADEIKSAWAQQLRDRIEAERRGG